MMHSDRRPPDPILMAKRVPSPVTSSRRCLYSTRGSLRSFDREFRDGAVRIVRETGKPIARVARELGLNEGTLGRWVNLDRRAREGEGPLSESERDELNRLRKGNAELAMERDVLKRSATDRFRTSRSIRSWAFSDRSRFNSATSSVESPWAPSRSPRSLATQLPRVPALISRSRAISAIDLPDSRTIRTAPSLNSCSYWTSLLWHGYSS